MNLTPVKAAAAAAPAKAAASSGSVAAFCLVAAQHVEAAGAYQALLALAFFLMVIAGIFVVVGLRQKFGQKNPSVLGGGPESLKTPLVDDGKSDMKDVEQGEAPCQQVFA